MDQKEYDRMDALVEALIRREKMYCADYVMLNPEDRKRREAIRDIKLEAYNEVRRTIRSAYMNGAEEL